jgi:hypothetical protein
MLTRHPPTGTSDLSCMMLLALVTFWGFQGLKLQASRPRLEQAIRDDLREECSY